MLAPDDSWSAEAELLSRLRSRSDGAKLGIAHELMEAAKNDVYVLIFNEGRTDEGVYTLQDCGTAQSYMLAFEEEDEASRFAMLLQADDFDLPSPVSWPSEHVTEFCSAAGFLLGLVPEGTLLVPPATNFYVEDVEDVMGPEDPIETQSARDRLEMLFGLPSRRPPSDEPYDETR
jgi:hypothetical protein